MNERIEELDRLCGEAIKEELEDFWGHGKFHFHSFYPTVNPHDWWEFMRTMHIKGFRLQIKSDEVQWYHHKTPNKKFTFRYDNHSHPTRAELLFPATIEAGLEALKNMERS